MSIVTKTGDDGSTALMYNRRVSKCDPRVEACGTIDELKAAIGLSIAFAHKKWLQERLQKLAKSLVPLMGEVATQPEDLPRYVNDGFIQLTSENVTPLDQIVDEVESQIDFSKGWATIGANQVAAFLDLARTICRRAERQIRYLQEAKKSLNNVILVYLNRLSDVLWLLARWAEANEKKPVEA